MRNHTSVYDKSDPQHSRHDCNIEIYDAIGLLVGLTCEYFYSWTHICPLIQIGKQLDLDTIRLPTFS